MAETKKMKGVKTRDEVGYMAGIRIPEYSIRAKFPKHSWN